MNKSKLVLAALMGASFVILLGAAAPINFTGKYQLHSTSTGAIYVIDTTTGKTKLISHGEGKDKDNSTQLGIPFDEMKNTIPQSFF